MNNYKIYITKEGEVGVIEMPDIKDFKDSYLGEWIDREAYESTLTKAKENVVLFKDQEHLRRELWDTKFRNLPDGQGIKDTIHDIPEGYSVELEPIRCRGEEGGNGYQAVLKKLPSQQPSAIDARSGKEQKPIWYTKEEISHWMKVNNYAENIREELSESFAKSLQSSFDKGYEKANKELQSEITRLQAELKEKEEFVDAYKETLKADLNNAVEKQEVRIQQTFNSGREEALRYALLMLEKHQQLKQKI